MSKVADVDEPAIELERLIADLSESGLSAFVFSDGLTTAHRVENKFSMRTRSA